MKFLKRGKKKTKKTKTKKKNRKITNGLVNKCILSSNPVFAMRSNYEYTNIIIYTITEIWYYDYSYVNRHKVPNPQFFNTNPTRKIIKFIVHLKVMKNSFLVIKKKKFPVLCN